MLSFTQRGTYLALSALLLPSAAHADLVVMKNGDRVTGSIVKKDGKNLIIKTDQFGVVTAAWDQVESIKADKPVTVVLEDGKAVQGTLVTNEGKVEVAGLSVPPAQIKIVRDSAEQAAYERLLKPGWGELWTGAGSIGFAGTTGNAKTLTFTTGVNAARNTRNDKTFIHFNSIKASALNNGVSSGTAQAIRGGLGYNHNISSRLFINVFNDYEYDKFQNLDLRFVLGGGLGVQVIKTDRSRFDLLAGAAFNHSSFSTPLTRKSAELYWGDEYSLKFTGTTSLVQSFRMFNDLTNTGDYRMNIDIGLTTKISKWLVWNVSLSDRYLSNPAPGRKTNDFLYTTGLGVTFSR